MKEYGLIQLCFMGQRRQIPFGATQVPVYQSSAFRHDTAEELGKDFCK